MGVIEKAFAQAHGSYEAIVANLEALRNQVAQAATGDALLRANTEISRRIELIEANSDTLYALAAERLLIDDCE